MPVSFGRPAGLTCNCSEEVGAVPQSDARPDAPPPAVPVPVTPPAPKAPSPAVVVCACCGAADPRLPGQLRALVRSGAGPVVILDVGALRSVDLVTVDALARLQLLARGLGARLRLRGPSKELTALLDLAGLADIVPGEPG